MAARRVIQFLLDYGPVIGLWVLLANLLLQRPIFENESNVVGSAQLAIVCMGLTWMYSYAFAGRLCDSHSPSFRALWSLGLLSLFLHIAIAFDVSHKWSHDAAVEHVRQVGGFGGGIVVNYVFATVWLADVVWWWVFLTGHENRPRWVTWAIHGFLLFVVVNSTVVFGAGDRRWGYAFGLLFFPLLAIAGRYALDALSIFRPTLKDIEPSREPHSPT